MLRDHARRRGDSVECRQSNHEGQLVDWLQARPARGVRRDRLQPRRVHALLDRAARHGRRDHGAGRGGAPVQRARPRGVSAPLGDRRRRARADLGLRAAELSARASTPSPRRFPPTGSTTVNRHRRPASITAAGGRASGCRVDTDEAALIERCRAGDLAAFEPLVEKYRQRVYRLAYNVLRDPEEAWDVAQDALHPRLSGAAVVPGRLRVLHVAVPDRDERGAGPRPAARRARPGVRHRARRRRKTGTGSSSDQGPRPTPTRRKSRSASGSAGRSPLCRSRTGPLSC